MPIYEYLCQECRTRFEVLRPMKDADTPIECQRCGGMRTTRCLALFNASSGGRAVAGSGGGCSGCSGGSCSSCGN